MFLQHFRSPFWLPEYFVHPPGGAFFYPLDPSPYPVGSHIAGYLGLSHCPGGGGGSKIPSGTSTIADFR